MIPDTVSASARDKAPDFRARAMAKQAWLVRRSEPKRGLLLGLIAGGAIGCLGALAVTSIVPNEGPARATTAAAVLAANQPNAVQTVSTEPATKTGEASKPSGEALRAAAIPAAATVVAKPAAVRSNATRTDVSSNAKVPAVTPAEPPATLSLTSDVPVLAQGGTPESTPKVAEKKKKKKKQIVRQQHRARPNDWARRDNFFFASDRMSNNF